MAAWDDVRGIALALPETDEHLSRGNAHWRVREDGYPAVLVRLEQIDPADLEELIVDAWLARAPRRLARGYLERLG